MSLTYFAFFNIVFCWFYSPHFIFTFIIFEMVACHGLIDSIFYFFAGCYRGASLSWQCVSWVDAVRHICGMSTVDGVLTD